MWAARELKVAVSLRSGIRPRQAPRRPISSILAGRLLHVTTAASGTGPTKLRGAANPSGFGGSTDYFGGVNAAQILTVRDPIPDLAIGIALRCNNGRSDSRNDRPTPRRSARDRTRAPSSSAIAGISKRARVYQPRRLRWACPRWCSELIRTCSCRSGGSVLPKERRSCSTSVVIALSSGPCAKARLARHHLRVGSRRLSERDRFDHRRGSAQHAETERCVACGRVARESAAKVPISEYQVRAQCFDRLRPNAEDDRDAFGTQTFEGFGDRLAARSGDQNHLRATDFLQSGAGVRCGAVDEMMGAELLRQFGFVGAAGNRRDLEAHVARILHRQVTKPAEAEYRDEIGRLRRRVS